MTDETQAFPPPKRIWLQWGDDSKHEAEVTWCTSKINDDDVEYQIVERPDDD